MESIIPLPKPFLRSLKMRDVLTKKITKKEAPRNSKYVMTYYEMRLISLPSIAQLIIATKWTMKSEELGLCQFLIIYFL